MLNANCRKILNRQPILKSLWFESAAVYYSNEKKKKKKTVNNRATTHIYGGQKSRKFLERMQLELLWSRLKHAYLRVITWTTKFSMPNILNFVRLPNIQLCSNIVFVQKSHEKQKNQPNNDELWIEVFVLLCIIGWTAG